MSAGGTHASAVDIARVLLGEASPDEARRLEEHAAACARCAEELRQARGSAASFHARVFARTLPAVERRRRRAVRWRLWMAPIVAAAAAVLVLVMVQRRPDADERGFKGAGVLQVFGLHGKTLFAVRDGTVMRAGDRIRFAVHPGPGRYVCVGSADGRGQANLYYRNVQLEKDAGDILPDSLVLDDAPGPERFFAIFSNQSLEDAAVRRALLEVASQGPAAIRRIRRLDLPLVQATVLIEKEER
ncbi:MAG TPA: zf-HC2 domain-containing protein [Myxococcales bacterium]|nr:zf-HC2 domain-containing protein [Myxococcales bacterium]